MQDEIFIFGHLNPDTDSILSSILFAKFKNLKENTNIYKPKRIGKINNETKFILEKLNQTEPMLIEKVENNQKVCLVDHNEFSQSVKNIENADLIEIIDHHKISFKYSKPINFITKTYGCTATIICELFEINNLQMQKIDKQMALFAILSDTVILKSPTTTNMDKKYVMEFSKELGIDYTSLGIEMFSKKTNENMTINEIFKTDYKEIKIKDKLFGIGQYESVNLDNLKNKKDQILIELQKQEKEAILILTDIIKEGSFIFANTLFNEKIEKKLNKKINNFDDENFIKGLLSRKKQVIPLLEEL